MRSIQWSAVAILAVSAALLAPGTPFSQEQAETPTEKDRPRPLVIPAEAKARKNPVAPEPPSLGRGGELYNSQCTMCHGTLGNGKGDLATSLGMTVPDFTDAESMKRRTDGELFYILSNGHSSMPGEGKRLSEEWRWDIVNYIRALPKK